jgi:hypothetical protein
MKLIIQKSLRMKNQINEAFKKRLANNVKEKPSAIKGSSLENVKPASRIVHDPTAKETKHTSPRNDSHGGKIRY